MRGRMQDIRVAFEGAVVNRNAKSTSPSRLHVREARPAAGSALSGSPTCGVAWEMSA